MAASPARLSGLPKALASGQQRSSYRKPKSRRKPDSQKLRAGEPSAKGSSYRSKNRDVSRLQCNPRVRSRKDCNRQFYGMGGPAIGVGSVGMNVS